MDHLDHMANYAGNKNSKKGATVNSKRSKSHRNSAGPQGKERQSKS